MAIVLNGTTGMTTPGVTNSGNQTIAGTLNGENYTPYAMRNRIINGAMVIDQRNAGASASLGSSGTYYLDRWIAIAQSGSGHTIQQVSDAPTGFVSSLKVTIGTGAAPTATQQTLLWQPIEGYNVADLGYGAAGALTTMVSFWVKCSLTGAFSAWAENNGSTRSYISTFTINAANTWEFKTLLITGDSSGTWLKTNGAGMLVGFSLGVGSNFISTANTWAAADYKAASGSVSLVSTTGATFQVTGIQLEKSATATPFEFRPYGTEFALCQRYYEAGILRAQISQTSYIGALIPFAVGKRASPTIAWSDFALNANKFSQGAINNNGLAAGGVSASAHELYMDGITSAALTLSNNWWGLNWIASAEL